MLGVTLITDATGSLSRWETALRQRFPFVRVKHDERSAAREGLVSAEVNALVVQQDGERVYGLERPTTVREYTEQDLAYLSRLVPEPRRYFALDYSDAALLREVLLIIANAGQTPAAVADDAGGITSLAAYLSQAP